MPLSDTDQLRLSALSIAAFDGLSRSRLDRDLVGDTRDAQQLFDSSRCGLTLGIPFQLPFKGDPSILNSCLYLVGGNFPIPLESVDDFFRYVVIVLLGPGAGVFDVNLFDDGLYAHDSLHRIFGF